MRDVFLIDAVRTPIGRFQGALSAVRPDDMAGLVIAEAVRRAGVDGGQVDEVYFGCANQAGEDNRNVARMALLLAGLPQHVPGITVNRLCASGLSAVNQATRMIRCAPPAVKPQQQKQITTQKQPAVHASHPSTRQASILAPTSPRSEQHGAHKATTRSRITAKSDSVRRSFMRSTEDGQTRPQQPTKPNLLQIANGFLDHMKKNSKSRVNVIGNDNAKPTGQQLREERYLERLNACVHNSYSIHRKQAPYLGREKKEMYIRVSLNKLGNLIDLKLLDSCGNRHVDQFILFLFRDAASSFPPLPSYVKHDPYTLNYTIFVNNQTSTPIQALLN